uniref:Tetratricopeptide SHNi-TPR domain-containing protein n=1 Tax=Glossina morsitans morsitans TaxID=37546 RepID=A0A1B0G2N6_GLOMM
MSANEEKSPVKSVNSDITIIEQERANKILKAKELYSHGSRNFLVKSYTEAADELSQVCGFYEDLYGELSDELGMPYLLYAKSLIALALDENKVIDVPDEDDEDDDDDDGDDDDGGGGDGDGDGDQLVEKSTNVSENKEDVETSVKDTKNNNETKIVSNGSKLASIKESTEPEATIDSTDDVEKKETKQNEKSSVEKTKDIVDKSSEESQVSSTDDGSEDKKDVMAVKEVKTNGVSEGSSINDGEKPSTSNGEKTIENGEDIEEDEAASNLQLAWEILELAAKIFERQGERGLANLAEVQTELANIEFENNILDAAREDYHKALSIYKQLPNNYRRAMAEIHYKIGLSYLMQQLNKDGSGALKEACKLIEDEIAEIQTKTEINDKDKNNIEDMEETKQEIWAKIAEIEEAQAQNIAEVRAALDSYIKPLHSVDSGAGTSKSVSADATSPLPSSSTNSSTAITSSAKPTDISHLIKRKRPEEPTSEAEAASPAKRPAL